MLDELIGGLLENQPQINVFRSKIAEPEGDLAQTFYGKMQVFNSDFFYLHLKDHARFLVTQPEDVTNIHVDLLEEHDWPIVKSWLFGSVFTAALQMNNRFAIHASAVMKDNQLYLFCGHSGIGKSTIASQLHTKGYPLFSDDKCVLFWSEKNALQSYPSLKITRLWENSAEELTDDGFIHSPTKVALRQNKYQYLLSDAQVIDECKCVHSIYRIHDGPKDSRLQIKHPAGIQKIKQFRNQTHRLNYVKGLGKQKIHWEYMQKIIQNIPYSVINRPKGTSISEFVDFVEQNIIKH